MAIWMMSPTEKVLSGLKSYALHGFMASKYKPGVQWMTLSPDLSNQD